MLLDVASLHVVEAGRVLRMHGQATNRRFVTRPVTPAIAFEGIDAEIIRVNTLWPKGFEKPPGHNSDF